MGTKEMYQNVERNMFGRREHSTESTNHIGTVEALGSKSIRVFADAYDRFRTEDKSVIDVRKLQELIKGEKCMVLVPWSESSASEAMLMEASERLAKEDEDNTAQNAAATDFAGLDEDLP